MTIPNLTFKLLAAITVIGIVAGSLFSQSTASGSGYITDQGGVVIPNVQLKLQNVATGAIRIGLSNTMGLFTFVLVPPGTKEFSGRLPVRRCSDRRWSGACIAYLAHCLLAECL